MSSNDEHDDDVDETVLWDAESPVSFHILAKNPPNWEEGSVSEGEQGDALGKSCFFFFYFDNPVP